MKAIVVAASLAVVGLVGTAQAHPHHGGYQHGYGSPAYGPGYGPHAGYKPYHSARPAPYLRRHRGYYGGGYGGGHKYRNVGKHYGPHPYGGYDARPSYSYGHPYGPPYPAYGFGPLDVDGESYNFGYSGGPTFGEGRRPVINGVQVFRAP